jgi:tetratricopeptide (TPR) repeat protein
VSGPFVGREDELTELANLLSSGNEAIGRVIHGLGGVGKSELALRYVYANRSSYRLVWWIDAASAQQITIGLAGLTTRLHSPAQLAYAQEWAVGWLQSHGGWLLILDNVEDPEDIVGLLGQLNSQGHILVTTRRDFGSALWGKWGLVPLRLTVLSEAASVDLLIQLSGRPVQHADAAELAEGLGHLPLALEQAGSYINQRHITIDDYRKRLAEEPARIYATGPEGSRSDRVVARIWAVTMNTVFKRSHLAYHIVFTMAYLASQPLPADVLTQLGDAHDVEDALTALASYSLIEHSGTHVRVHPLVQSVSREWLEENCRTTNAKDGPCRCTRHRLAAINMLLATLPPDPRNDVSGWPRWNELLPHVITLAANIRHRIFDFGKLYGLAGQYLQSQGQFTQAVEMFEMALADYSEPPRPLRGLWLSLRNDLAVAYANADRFDDSIKMFESMGVNAVKAKGNRNQNFLIRQANLGNVYTQAGRPDKGISLLESALAGLRRLLGNDDPTTLSTRHNLATAYKNGGRLGDAVTLFEAVVADSSRVFGPEHPRTLNARHGLAGAYDDLGKRAEATELSVAVANDRARILGPDHPQTLLSRLNAAVAEHQAGAVDEAIPKLAAVLVRYEQTRGQDDPTTLSARNHLAGAYQSAGRLVEATTLFEAILADRRRVLGPEHPDVLISRHNLAAVYAHVGRLDESIALLEALLPDNDRLLGPGNPGTLSTRSLLAGAYCQAGRLTEGIAVYAAVLEQATTFEPGNPMMLTIKNNLALIYQQADRGSEAIPLFEEITAAYAEHPDRNVKERLSTSDNLAASYLNVGRTDEAIRLLESNLEDWTRLLGAANRETLTCRNNLAHAYLQAGRIEDASAAAEDVLRGCEETYGPQHPYTLLTRVFLASLADGGQ